MRILICWLALLSPVVAQTVDHADPAAEAAYDLAYRKKVALWQCYRKAPPAMQDLRVGPEIDAPVIPGSGHKIREDFLADCRLRVDGMK